MRLQISLICLIALFLAACAEREVDVEPTPIDIASTPVVTVSALTPEPTSNSPLTSTVTPASPTAQPTATASVELQVSATATSPNSVQFTVSPAQPQPGESLTFTWDASTAETPENGHCITVTTDTSDLMGAYKSWCGLPDTGTLTISLPTVNRDRFKVGFDIKTPPNAQWLKIRLPCPDNYFFPASVARPPSASGLGWHYNFAVYNCPDKQVVYAAFEQAFERGRMLQFDGQIYILFDQGDRDNPLFHFFNVDPNQDTTPVVLEPPAGEFAPDAAIFARVWQEETLSHKYLWDRPKTLREVLGWATAPMQRFQMVMQQPWLTQYDFHDADDTITNLSGPYDFYYYLRLVDGQTVFLSEYPGHGQVSYWTFINP